MCPVSNYRYDAEKRCKYVVGSYRDFCTIFADERAILLLSEDRKSLTILNLDTERLREIRPAAQATILQCFWQSNGWIACLEEIATGRYSMRFLHPDTDKTLSRIVPTTDCVVSQNSLHYGYIDTQNNFHYLEMHTGRELRVIPKVGSQNGDHFYQMEKNRLFSFEMNRNDNSQVIAQEYELTTGTAQTIRYVSILVGDEVEPDYTVGSSHRFIAQVYHGGGEGYNSYPDNLCVSWMKPIKP